MTASTAAAIDARLATATFVDPHSHIDPHAPAARSLADILGYHYYTELAHSAGVARESIEGPGLAPEERVERIVAGLGPLTNTIQHAWLMEIAADLFGFDEPTLDRSNWRRLADLVASHTSRPEWEETVLARNRMEAVFLTNDFDDPLEGFDTTTYVPCLRVDELVFHTGKPGVLERLERSSGTATGDRAGVHRAIAALAERFIRRGARAAAISLPPDFRPWQPEAQAAERALATVRREGPGAPAADRAVVAADLFWRVAECCDAGRLPFDLMIGVRRAVYPGGVHQGQDLLDGRLSLADYAPLFNAFPRVAFPVSVLSHPLNHELVSVLLDLPQRPLRSATGGTPTRRRRSNRTSSSGSRRCRGRSSSATTATCTRSSSATRSSPCTAASWPACWRGASWRSAAGARSGPSTWASTCSCGTRVGCSTPTAGPEARRRPGAPSRPAAAPRRSARSPRGSAGR